MTFVGMLIWLPTLLPIKPANKVRTTADLIREYDYQPLVLPRLPALEDSAPNARIPQSASVALRVPPAAKRTLVSHLPKPDYSGPQEMASDPPDPTNTVEIVRRLDLVAPPDLVYPVRLPSLVMLPPRATPLPVALKVDPPVLAQPQQIDIAVAEPSAENPALPVSAPKLLLAALAPAAPRTIGFDRSRAAFNTTSAPDIKGLKAAVVINVVSVPAEPVPIPDAQLSGKLVVAQTKEAKASDNAAGSVEVGAVPNVLSYSLEVTANAAVSAARTASSSAVGVASPSGGGTGAAGKTNLPGISISGGVPGRTASPIAISPRASYGITVISGGGSGGPSRDLGVFGRNETVYTIYIPMADATGGSAWPFEYALLSPAPAGNGLPVPPIALKKVPATSLKSDVFANTEPVFVTAIISATGKIEALRALRASDDRAQAAINALAQWEFQPAQLDGKPVASKVLIGVTIVPEVR